MNATEKRRSAGWLAAVPTGARVFLVAPPLLSGCFEDGDDTPQLLVPEDIELHWDDSFNGRQDGRMALVPVDVMIYDGTTGEPLGLTALDVHLPHGDGAAIVLPDSVVPAEPDQSADELELEWDVWRDRYFEPFAVEEMSTSIRVRTDDSGLARFYVYVDAFATGSTSSQFLGGRGADAGFAPVPVVVSMGMTDDTFLLVPR